MKPREPIPKQTITLSVNEQQHTIAIEPRRILLDALRHDLGLTGTKKVCAMGDCGACTVHLDGEAVYSCLVLGVECDGRDVATIEGVADGNDLHPIQQAFIECDAYQCGYCTAGQIMSLKALLDHNDAPNESDIVRSVSGNLCRCGAYQNIVKAGVAAAEKMQEAQNGN